MQLAEPAALAYAFLSEMFSSLETTSKHHFSTKAIKYRINLSYNHFLLRVAIIDKSLYILDWTGAFHADKLEMASSSFFPLATFYLGDVACSKAITTVIARCLKQQTDIIDAGRWSIAHPYDIPIHRCSFIDYVKDDWSGVFIRDEP